LGDGAARAGDWRLVPVLRHRPRQRRPVLLVVRARALSDRSPAAARARCAACSAPLESDQEWCVECGAARTVLHRPPDWRAPVAVIAVVVGIVVIAGLIALVSLPR